MKEEDYSKENYPKKEYEEALQFFYSAINVYKTKLFDFFDTIQLIMGDLKNFFIFPEDFAPRDFDGSNCFSLQFLYRGKILRLNFLLEPIGRITITHHSSLNSDQNSVTIWNSHSRAEFIKWDNYELNMRIIAYYIDSYIKNQNQETPITNKFDEVTWSFAEDNSYQDWAGDTSFVGDTRKLISSYKNYNYEEV